jgi:ketosteroid isomerase-like protein
VSRPAIEVVEAIYQAFELRDMPAVFKLFAANIEISQSDQLPWGGTFKGHDGARRFLTGLTSRINPSLRIDRFIKCGDDVVAIGWTRGKVNATGVAYRVPIVHVWRVHDGKAARIQFFVDNPLMLAALGERRKNA